MDDPSQIAESGSFTAAATRLGYTQSAVSRQAAALERSAGTALFERRPDGVGLTLAGLTLLRHARTILDCLTAAERDLTGTVSRTELVRLGLFLSAGAAILPLSLTRLAATDPQITVTTTEGTTPSLVRALRAGSIDLAVLTSRPPHRPLDGESPRLHVETVMDTELVVAVPSTGEFAGRTAVHVDELIDAPWIAAPASNAEPLLGVWPGLPGRPDIVHCARDWLTKLQLVAGGFGVTTVPSRLSPVLPPGVSPGDQGRYPSNCLDHLIRAADRQIRCRSPPRARTITGTSALVSGFHKVVCPRLHHEREKCS
ncbi:LysR family transcriptional regulator [Streptomyces sp. NPDC005402]|uniref:LysR family transcriptional regulator n=1 Tax=Streptomyces sp. NPDC005402 TaxID=3155338 RepID=UPI0033B62425